MYPIVILALKNNLSGFHRKQTYFRLPIFAFSQITRLFFYFRLPIFDVSQITQLLCYFRLPIFDFSQITQLFCCFRLPIFDFTHITQCFFSIYTQIVLQFFSHYLVSPRLRQRVRRHRLGSRGSLPLQNTAPPLTRRTRNSLHHPGEVDILNILYFIVEYSYHFLQVPIYCCCLTHGQEL